MATAALAVKDRSPPADNETVTGFARRHTDRAETLPAEPSGGAERPPRAADQQRAAHGDPIGITIPAVLAGWAALHAVLTPLVVDGPSVPATLAVDVLATAALTTAVLLIRRPNPRALAVALAVAAVLGAARALASGQPLTGLDTGVCLVAAAVLLSQAQLSAVVTATLAGWAAAASYGIAHALTVGSVEGEVSGQVAGRWAYAASAVAASALVAFAVRGRASRPLPTPAATPILEDGESVRDTLTGLANRVGVELVATPMIEHARRSGQAVHCLYLDVDGLRAVNEAVGLAGGDAVLRDVAEVVRECVRATDVVSRWTGDEFVVLGPGTGMSPLELERRVRARLVTRPPVAVEVWNGRVSIGSATLVPWDDGDLASLVAKGELDMQMRRSLRRQSAERLAGPLGPRAGDATGGKL